LTEGTAIQFAAQRIARTGKTRAQIRQIVIEQIAETGDGVIDRNVQGRVLVRLVAKAAKIGLAAIALADARLERGAAARAPQHTRIPDNAILIVGQQTGRRFIGDEPTIIADHRHAIDIAHRIAFGNLDIFVTDPADQRQTRRDRHGDISARIFAFITLIKLAAVFAFPASAHGPSKGKVARLHADTGTRRVAHAVVENIDRQLTRRQGAGGFILDFCIAYPVVRIDIERAHAGRKIRTGIDRIDLRHIIDVTDGIGRRRTAQIDAAAGSETARFQ